jgi:hypothetical protein
MRIRPYGVGLRPALACRLDSVLAWACPGGGRVEGDETPGSGARAVVCVFFYLLRGRRVGRGAAEPSEPMASDRAGRDDGAAPRRDRLTSLSMHDEGRAGLMTRGIKEIHRAPGRLARVIGRPGPRDLRS